MVSLQTNLWQFFSQECAGHMYECMNQTLMHSARSIIYNDSENRNVLRIDSGQNAKCRISSLLWYRHRSLPVQENSGTTSYKIWDAWSHGRMVACRVVQETCSVNQDTPHFMCPISCYESTDSDQIDNLIKPNIKCYATNDLFASRNDSWSERFWVLSLVITKPIYLKQYLIKSNSYFVCQNRSLTPWE